MSSTCKVCSGEANYTKMLYQHRPEGIKLCPKHEREFFLLGEHRFIRRFNLQDSFERTFKRYESAPLGSLKL